MANVVAFGNPLLDTIVLINDVVLLEKYDLAVDGQKEISQDEMIMLKNDIKTYEKTVTAGGCGQNTLKIMKWILGDQCSPTIFGAVGEDQEAEILQRILKESGVHTKYVKHELFSTGATVSLVSEENRSLVACLGAAEVLSIDDVVSCTTIIDGSDLVYMEGFFLTKRVDAVNFILNYCSNKKKVFAFNLSGEYLCKEYPETVKHLVEKSVIIFGNKREFQALCPFMGKHDVYSLIEHISADRKIVVMTDGANDVICKSGVNKFQKIQAPKMKTEEIVDTTGAGDSFVAGFLAGHLLQKDLDFCMKLGCYAAQEIIKHRGCLVPDKPPIFNV